MSFVRTQSSQSKSRWLAVALALAAFALCAGCALFGAGCAGSGGDNAASDASSEEAASSESAANASAEGSSDEATEALEAVGATGEIPVLVSCDFEGSGSSTRFEYSYDEEGNLVKETMQRTENGSEITRDEQWTFDGMTNVPIALVDKTTMPSGSDESAYAYEAPTAERGDEGITIIETALPDAMNDYPAAVRRIMTLTDNLDRLTSYSDQTISITGQKVETAADLVISSETTMEEIYRFNDDGTLGSYVVNAYGETTPATLAYDGDTVTVDGDWAGTWTLERDASGAIVSATNAENGFKATYTYEMRSGFTAVNRALALSMPGRVFTVAILQAIPASEDAAE